MIIAMRRLLTAAAAYSLLSSAGFAAEQPNIIIILADDLGYNDVGYQHSSDIPTPNIDALAAQGTVAEAGYVAHSLCMPSRSGLMTGREPAKMGIYTNPPASTSPEIGLPPGETTLAQVMKSAGYATAAIGKWHLGADSIHHPNNRGFDYFYGFLGGQHSYFTSSGIQRNGAPAGFSGYLTFALGDEAISFVESHTEQPFFLYLAFNAPHLPLQAPQEYLDRFANIANPARRTYAAMVSAMDDTIGRIIASTRDLGRDTLTIFLSDNGAAPANGGSNLPLKGNKGSAFDGGVRVPMILHMPGTLPVQHYKSPVSSLDFLPTLATLVGASKTNKPLDGINVWPDLVAQQDHDRTLHWIMNAGYPTAIRVGNWKVVKTSATASMLFDMKVWPPEKINVKSSHSSVYSDLTLDLTDWTSSLPLALWD